MKEIYLKLKRVHSGYTILQITNIFLGENSHLNLRIGQVKLHLEYNLRKKSITFNNSTMNINKKNM